MIRSFIIFLIATFILACSPEQKHHFSDADYSAIVTEINEIIAELAKAIVNGEAADVYDRYLAPDYRFTSAAGRVSTREQMLEELRRGSVKFEDFQFINDAETGKRLQLCFHDLRHIYAVSLYETGASLSDIKELLGHSSIRITEQRYANVSKSVDRNIVENLTNVIPLPTKKVV